MFLSPDEIAELTGLVTPAAQEKLLKSWGLTVFRSKANRVILAREALTRYQLGERASQAASKEPQMRRRAA